MSWALQNEHGDLGLDCERIDPFPPRSAIGTSLIDSVDVINNSASGAATLMNNIVDLAGESITMAKLRLEHLHGSKSIPNFEAISDRLPPNIVSFFDQLIAPILSRPAQETGMGLQALRILKDIPPPKGIERDRLKDMLLPGSGEHSPSIMQVLHATSGVLRLVSMRSEDEYYVPTLTAFHCDFHMYLQEDYNELVAGRTGT